MHESHSRWSFMFRILRQRHCLRWFRAVECDSVDVHQLSTGNHVHLQGPFQDKAAQSVHLSLFTFFWLAPVELRRTVVVDSPSVFDWKSNPNQNKSKKYEIDSAAKRKAVSSQTNHRPSWRAPPSAKSSSTKAKANWKAITKRLSYRVRWMCKLPPTICMIPSSKRRWWA